jgi:heme-degrading monooxygenase HmoA
MICRIWHGWTNPANAHEYERLLRAEIFRGIAGRGIAGYHGIELLRRSTGDLEFVTMMWFDSLEAVRTFRGAGLSGSRGAAGGKGTPRALRFPLRALRGAATPRRSVSTPLLAGLLLLFAVQPEVGSAQRPATVDDFLSLTRCEAGRAVTHIRPDVRDSLVLAQLEAHEAVHRTQASAYPTCEAFIASIRSARSLVDVELPAYCAQWRVAVAQGADSIEERREYAWRMAAQSGAMENRLDILQRFRRECSLAGE